MNLQIFPPLVFTIEIVRCQGELVRYCRELCLLVKHPGFSCHYGWQLRGAANVLVFKYKNASPGWGEAL